jgi:hypothetical protein
MNNMKKQEVEMIKDDLEVQASLAAVGNSDGGKILIKSLTRDIIDAIETLGYKHDTLTQQEFISLGSKIKTSIDMIQVLTNAEGNKEYYKELLEKALQEVE